MNTILKGGRIIDPYMEWDFLGDVIIHNAHICEVGQVNVNESDYEVIDISGMIISPGFVDLHCHLREPGEEEKETIATGTLAAASGGFTTICAMPNTRPPIDTPAMVEFIVNKSRSEGLVNVLPIACVTRSRQGLALTNMKELAHAGAVAFSDDGSPVQDDVLMTKSLIQSKELDIPVINHCEDVRLNEGGVLNDGNIANHFGLKGWPYIAEEQMVKRDISLAKSTGGYLHLAHISSAGSVSLIKEAKQNGLNITAEATPHHLTITEDIIQNGSGPSNIPYNMAKVNPPLRREEDIYAIINGLAEGVIDTVATDHAPHTKKDKDGTFTESAFGISGLETALGSLIGLVNSGYITLPNLIERLTIGPAKVLRNSGIIKPTLKPKSIADITIFDPEHEWIVDPEQFYSKGKNTPIAGIKLKGKVVMTIVKGTVVYNNMKEKID